MTDDPKKDDAGEDAGEEVGWDEALDEWEKRSFSPELAEDKETKRPATPLAVDRPSRPLYRPPTGPVVPAPRPKPPTLPRPPTPGRPAPPFGKIDVTLSNPLDDATTLADPGIPAAKPAGPRPSRAGLGQLFGKGPGEVRSKDDIDVLLEGPDDFGEKTEISDAPEQMLESPEELPDARPRLPSTMELQPGDVELVDEPPPPAPRHAAATPVPSSEHDPFRGTIETSPGLDEDDEAQQAVLVPLERAHDPDAETTAGSKAYVAARLAKEELAQSSYEREEPTKFYVAPAPAPRPVPTTKAWLPPEVRDAYEDRAAWLEAEARAIGDEATRARALLAVSEMRVLLGEPEAAHTLACEARDLAPSLPLAHRQVRALLSADGDPTPMVEALDRESAQVVPPAARVHAALLAADFTRLSGDDDGAARRWTRASSLSTDDVRPTVARAAFALRSGDLETARKLHAAPEAKPIADGLGIALLLRGAQVDGPPPEPGSPLAVNDALRRARQSLETGDVGAAAQAVADIEKVPELASGARWLAAGLGSTRQATRPQAAGWLKSLAAEGEELARRSLAACAVELGDASQLKAALEGSGFSAADRAVLAVLLDLPPAELEAQAAPLAETEAMAPLTSAIAATRPLPQDVDPEARNRILDARASRVAGSPATRGSLRIARLVTSGATAAQVQTAIAAMGEGASIEARAIALEMAMQADQLGEVSDTLRTWKAEEEGRGGPADHLLAAGLIAERGADKDRALRAYREAKDLDDKNEAVLRAAAAVDPDAPLGAVLNTLADDLGDGPRSAVLRLESVTRETALSDAAKLERLEKAQRAAPGLPIAVFLAERLARRSGNVDEVLRWIRERRTTATDPLEQALDAVREALLIADQNPDMAGERLEEAHRTRKHDVALRELYERLAREPPADRGPWREERAAVATGDARALFYMEAAHEYERAGDKPAALRAAEAAVASGDTMLARLARERAEVEGGSPARLADELLSFARTTESLRERREAYERLADLDATGRADTSSALLWHRSILEETPDHKPSLRHIEHALITEGRDDELDPIATAIARALAGATGGECTAHADLAARLRARGAAGDWESTREVAEISATQPEPSLGSLRLLNAHARWKRDDPTTFSTTLALIARASRPAELAALLLRAGEAALRMDSPDQARELLERAKTEDPGDLSTWTLLADVRRRADDPRGAAEAFEAVARTSAVPAHRLEAWVEAARLWLDAAADQDRGVAALEQAAATDVTYQDVFPRLSALYSVRGARNELASLLERRIATITDSEERVTMEVERGRALLEVGDAQGARQALEAALASNPDHTTALGAFAELCAKEKDWNAAEQAWVRLARLLSTPDEQRAIYARLGELYSVHSVNLSRAELAFKEVLKRAPGDVATLEQLVDVYKRQSDAAHAAEIVQQLVTQAKDPTDRRRRLVELAAIHEEPGHDLRKAEQVLESARREAPTDVIVLRALAEFYIRHKQMPAVHILLDRAAADARRAFAAGRFAPALFEVMRAVFELRGKKDASLVVAATLAALDGQPAVIRGGDARGLDPRLDDLLAPEVLSPPLRMLLSRTGDALDIAAPLDLKALQTTLLPATAAPLSSLIGSVANSVGLHGLQLLVSPRLARACVPASSAPATLVLGDGLLSTPNDRARNFLVVRALKLIMAHASALVRPAPSDVAVLVSAWLQAFNPSWKPQGINPTALANAARRIAAGLPKRHEPDVGVAALEVAGSLGNHAVTLGANALAWANRAALLAVGDPNAALDGIAWSHSGHDAPTDPKDRAAWVARTQEAKDLLAFSVSDAYSEARVRLGLDH